MTLSDRIDGTERLLEAAVREAGLVMTGDRRVSESDAERLLGYSPRYFAKLRDMGQAPAHYNRGMNGCRVSYRLADLADWIESSRE